MKKGYLGPFQMGTISGLSKLIEAAEKVTGERGISMESVFYTTAFQAGIDTFVTIDMESAKPTSQFVADRTIFLPSKSRQFTELENYFSKFLPAEWQRKIEYNQVICIMCFLDDLFRAMETNSSLLLPGQLPDIEKATPLLPDELLIPISNLLSSITPHRTNSITPQKVVHTDDVHRLNEIIESDLFTAHSEAQSLLDNSEVPVQKGLATAFKTTKKMYSKFPTVFSMKENYLGILEFGPKLIDTVFGGLPGRISEIGSKLVQNHIESKRRIVIYDFEDTLFLIALEKAAQMLTKANDNSPGKD